MLRAGKTIACENEGEGSSKTLANSRSRLTGRTHCYEVVVRWTGNTRLGGRQRGRRTQSALGKKSCYAEHVGLVVSGRAALTMDDGRVVEMKAGDVFYIATGLDKLGDG